MAIIKKSTNKKCQWECGKMVIVGGKVNCCNHYEKLYGDSSEIKNRTTIWSSNSTAEYIPKKENINSKKYT